MTAAPVDENRLSLPWALLRPDAYAHPAYDIRLHETHSSWVILSGPFAYKVKKPVNLGFLDFTSREQRLADCEDEVRLNRRLCPDVYLGVVDIVERDGRLALGGEGILVEPAVWMRRLPEEGMLTALLERGVVGSALVRRIGHHLARFHARAATGLGVDEHGSVATIRANWSENFAQTASFHGRTLDARLDDTISAYVRSFLDGQGSLLAQRVTRQRIRDGHGDLHAASICLEGRRLHFFDCLQFATRFRCADVAADVAFLAMDLAFHGRADLAYDFVEAYVHASDDEELRKLLDFNTCYRAYVRGKVRSVRLTQPGLDIEQAAEESEAARAYFDLAWAAAGGLGGPLLVVSMGLPASGKTTLARSLASRLGLVHLASDVVRKGLVGLTPTTRRHDAFQDGLYDADMTRRTYAALRRQAARWVRRGRSVVLDATYGDPAERAAIRRIGRRLGARLVVLVCRADDATLLARLAARSSDERTASDARLALWPQLRAAYSEPVEMTEAVHVYATGSEASTVREAMAVIRSVGATTLGSAASGEFLGRARYAQ